MNQFNGVFNKKRILLTGHTGFKGSWLALWLQHLGANVFGYSLQPPTDPSNYALANIPGALQDETIGDIRDRKLVCKVVSRIRPDVVFHLAAQPLVRESYSHPFDTFEVNTMGTASLLEAIRIQASPCAVVCITTDKCYENTNRMAGYCEKDPMGGHDPYSASKGAAEILIAAYRRAFFDPRRLAHHGVLLASARAGNVIGGGDWAKDRIVPDIVDSLTHNRPVLLRNPQAIRPWQHVLEPLSGYLTLAAAMLSNPRPLLCDAWNFGPGAAAEVSVGDLAEAFIRLWGSGSWLDCHSDDQPHEAEILKLSIEKARNQLGWTPRWSIDEAIHHTASWYKSVLRDNKMAGRLCYEDILAYGLPAKA